MGFVKIFYLPKKGTMETPPMATPLWKPMTCKQSYGYLGHFFSQKKIHNKKFPLEEIFLLQNIFS